jgi:Type I phosphodiesterase / nucleotide pyrophosphatase
MRFLRMLTNSLLAGALGAAYLAVIVLQLNPHVPLVSATTWRLYATLGLSYGIHLAVIFYVAMVMRELVGLGALSPGWASVRVLAWLAAASAGVAAVLMWLNVQGFAAALDAAAARRMTAGAAATTATAIVLLGLAAAHYSFGRRGSRVGAALLAIAVFGSLALPLAARGRVPESAGLYSTRTTSPVGASDGPRVLMLLLDGASLDYIWPRTAEGRLPNFARLLEAGATMDLATVRPTGPDPVWTAIATGMRPAKNGVRSTGSYYLHGDTRALTLLPDHCFSHVLVRFGVIRQEPNTEADLRSRPLWNILSESGMTVGVVRWPLTYPTEPVHGFVLSDRFHESIGSMLELDDRVVFPTEALPVARDAFAQQTDGSGVLVASDVPSPLAVGPEATSNLRDRLYAQAMRDLQARWPVRFSALRYQGLDTVGHYYLRYTQPREFGDLPEDERRRRLQVIDRYYGYIDREVGEAIAALTPGDLLLVVSGYGMARPNPVKHLVGRMMGNPINGTHERAPDGFLLAYGTVVEAGRRQQRGSIVDVTPTILYFLGLPVGRDMDGYARTDLFKRAFTAERPIAFIPTYNR